MNDKPKELRSKCEGGSQEYYQVEDGWMETFTGKKFFFGNPTQDSIDVHDIAHALGNLCRYGGHASRFYSVAEHSVLIANWVWSQRAGDAQLAFEALMHDATEGYLVDMPRPIKQKLSQYRAIEDNLATQIAIKFGLRVPVDPLIHEADSRIIYDERRQVMSSSGNDWGTDSLVPLGVTVDFLLPEAATARFMQAYGWFDDARKRQ